MNQLVTPFSAGFFTGSVKTPFRYFDADKKLIIRRLQAQRQSVKTFAKKLSLSF